MVMNPTIAKLNLPPKIPIAIGASLAIVGAYFSTKVATFGLFLFTYATVVGVGIGFCYFPPLQCGWEWEPKRKGMVTGVILGAFGFGSFVFSFLAKYIINPNNEKPTVYPEGKFYSPEVAMNFPKFFIIMAGSWTVLAIIAVILVKRNPNLSDQNATDNQDDMLTLIEGMQTT